MYLWAGIVWWKAVSNTPTIFACGRTALQASIPSNPAGLCKGANSEHSFTFSITSSVITTESLNFSPPWTILWPTASISFISEITPYSLLNSFSITKLIASLWDGTGCSNLFFSPLAVCVKKEESCPILS